jgi:hypothetical protein
MIILRSKMNPFAAIWYRFINDPLQIYLTVVCFWMVLSGRMPTTRKIWSQVPRSGVVVGGTVSRKVGVDAVPVPVSARTTGGIPLAEVTQVSAEEWEHETAQVPEEEEWQRETADTRVLSTLKLDDDKDSAPEAAAEAEPADAPPEAAAEAEPADAPPEAAAEAGEPAEPHAAASNGAVSTAAAVSTGAAVPTDAAVPTGAASNGAAVPTGAVSNGAVSNGTASNGAGANGAGETAEPTWADGAVPDWEADTGPIPRVSWEPSELSWDIEVLRLPERDGDDADGHSEANGHSEAGGETGADQQDPATARPEEIQPAERG